MDGVGGGDPAIACLLAPGLDVASILRGTLGCALPRVKGSNERYAPLTRIAQSQPLA